MNVVADVDAERLTDDIWGEEVDGLILRVQRMSTEDGPGIRSTVFMKGCSLRCEWCHNPESISVKRQVQWLGNRCIRCETCIRMCPERCLFMTPAGVGVNRERCTGCGVCVEECPTNALELLGTRITSEELMDELLRDRIYYETSGGGVTISGGEPAIQTSFVEGVLRQLREEGIHTALDTCGLCSIQSLERLLPHTDLVLFDLKEIDPARHARFTGQDNHRILSNLTYVADYIRAGKQDTTLWIRTPLIPGATATEENIAGLGSYMAENLAGIVQRWELCAFNNLCRDKYTRLGMEWRYADASLYTASELEEMAEWARQSGIDPSLVVVTGPTRVDGE